MFSFFSGLLPAALQAALMVILVRRRLYLRFPFFFTYTAYSIAVTLAQLWVMDRPVMFFVLYWSTEMIYGLLALLAIHEVFKSVLETYYSLHHWMRWLPPLAFLTVLGNSMWQALYRPMGRTAIAHFAAGAYAFVPGVLCLQAIVFVVCLRLGLRKHYPMRWGRYSAGILTGFGMVAVATLLIFMARFRFGPGMELLFRYGPPAAYAGAALTWVKAFYREEPPMTRKATNPEIYRRAANLTSEVTEDAEKDLGLRSVPSLP